MHFSRTIASENQVSLHHVDSMLCTGLDHNPHVPGMQCLYATSALQAIKMALFMIFPTSGAASNPSKMIKSVRQMGPEVCELCEASYYSYSCHARAVPHKQHQMLYQADFGSRFSATASILNLDPGSGASAHFFSSPHTRVLQFVCVLVLAWRRFRSGHVKCTVRLNCCICSSSRP